MQSKQSKTCFKPSKKSFKDVMSDSLSQSNASSIHEWSDISSLNSFDDSTSEHTKQDSPSHLGSFYYPLDELRKKYKREFKDAIRKNYKYMMSENIMDSCKVSEKELSAFESDDCSGESNVISYNEFVKQYKDLVSWLTNMHNNLNHNNKNNCCNCEKYLNQVHLEELLHRLTRRTQFHEYSDQLIIHYPSMKDDIIARYNHVDQLWLELEKEVSPYGLTNPINVIKDIEIDLQNFEEWIKDAEIEMNALKVNLSSVKQMEVQQFVMNLQREIQSKSKLVTSIFQMCDNLLSGNTNQQQSSGMTKLKFASSILEDRLNVAKNRGMSLQHRWEALYISCLEWQLRLEKGMQAHQLKGVDKKDLELDEQDVVFDSNHSLCMIEEEREHEVMNPENDVNDAGVHVHPAIADGQHLTAHDGDYGYSSDGQRSPGSLKSILKAEPLEGLITNTEDDNCYDNKRKVSECNIGSDLSDSSGVAISATTGSSLKSKSDVTCNLYGPGLVKPMNVFKNYDSCMPTSEDETSNDEAKVILNMQESSRSLDILPGGLIINRKTAVKDEPVSDGEIFKSDIRYLPLESLGAWNKHKTRLHLNASSSKEDVMIKGKFKSLQSTKKIGEESFKSFVVKSPRKRTYSNRHFLSLSEDNFMRIKSQMLPGCKVRKVTSLEGLNFDLRRCYEEEEEEDLRDFNGSKMKGEIIEENQLVPDNELMGSTVDEISSFHSEVELTDVEAEDLSFKSNVDLWLEDNIFDNNFYKNNKHSSTPKQCHQSNRGMSKQFLQPSNPAVESDSDAEDFQVVLHELRKALLFSKQVVEKVVKAWADPDYMPDPSKLLEPLATCETSINCLQDLMEALLNHSRADCNHQVTTIKDLLEDWMALKDIIETHHQQAITTVKSIVLKLEGDLNKSIEMVHMMMRSSSSSSSSESHDDDDHTKGDQADGFNILSLLDMIRNYKAEKDNIFALKDKLSKMMKSGSGGVMKKKKMGMMLMGISSDNDDPIEKMDKLHVLSTSYLSKLAGIISSLISAIEPYSRFTNLKKEVTILLDQSEASLQSLVQSQDDRECALIQLLSAEMKGEWIMMSNKVQEMQQVKSSMYDLVPGRVQRSLDHDLEVTSSRYNDVQLKSVNFIRNVISVQSLVSGKDEVDGADDDHDKSGKDSNKSSYQKELVPGTIGASTCDDGLINSNKLVNEAVGTSRTTTTTTTMTSYMKRILKVGLPITAAVLFLGWFLSYNNGGGGVGCGGGGGGDWFGDWGLVLFPSLRYNRGRPAI